MAIEIDGIATPPVYPVVPVRSALEAIPPVQAVAPAAGGAGHGGPDAVYEPAPPGSRDRLTYADPRRDRAGQGGEGGEGGNRPHDDPAGPSRARLTAALGHYSAMASLAHQMSQGSAGAESGGGAVAPGFTRYG